jgi:hypothetical protein
VSYLREIVRPWKLATLAWGVGSLLYGAAVEQAPDWDVGVSLLMAAVAYLSAPQAIRLLGSLEWRKVLLGLALVWFGADGCYAIYWSIKDPVALALMRDANLLPSTCLYLLCGMVWRPRSSLLDGLRAVSAALHFR